MANKKGSKLHSIIEKLSEQCVRVSPTEDPNIEQIITVTAQPPRQRNTTGNGKTKRPKRHSKATKTSNKKSLTSSKKLRSQEDEIKNRCQPVDDDLCIDVNALISIVPQLQDIDVENAAGNSLASSCSICLLPVKNKKELLNHLKDCHTGEVGKIIELDQEEQEQDEEEFEEEMEESDENNHSESDPDFDVDVDSDTEVSSDDMTVPLALNRKRRSTRIKAIKGSESTESNESEESGQHSSNPLDSSDIHIDVEKFINTSPRLEDIDMPKTKEYGCKLCEERYYFKIELDSHVEKIHPENADNSSQSSWNCEHCSKPFLSKKALLLHIDKVVQRIERKERIQEEKRKKKEKKNTCRHCGKICKNSGSLKKHYTTHSDDRPFKCDICDRSFKDKSYVYRHKKTHTGIKNYECNYCKKLFAHSGSLRTHIMLHTGERPFKCQFCETGFISKFDLKVHENKHTGNMPYKCPHCSKSFPKSNNLKMHLISHSTDKPFPCEVCGKAFKRRDHLRYHLVIHSDDKPYKCDTCNKTFNQHICLRKHLPCRELEKLEKRANKPKENSYKQQKLAKKSQQNKEQVYDHGNNTSTSTNMTTDQEKQQNPNSNDSIEVQEDTASQLPVIYMNTDSTATENQQETNETQTNQPKEQIPPENMEALSSDIVHSVTSSKEQTYATSEIHGSESVNLDSILSSSRQNTVSGLGLSSLIDRGSANATVRHCSIDKIDFSNDFRVPNLENSTSSIRTFTHPQRLAEACIYTSSVHIQQPFVPFNCSSQSASGMEYEAGGLELVTLPSDGSHGNILGNRSFPHETPNELSSALLAAMDPDNITAMVESTSAFFPSA